MKPVWPKSILHFILVLSRNGLFIQSFFHSILSPYLLLSSNDNGNKGWWTDGVNSYNGWWLLLLGVLFHAIIGVYTGLGFRSTVDLGWCFDDEINGGD